MKLQILWTIKARNTNSQFLSYILQQRIAWASEQPAVAKGNDMEWASAASSSLWNSPKERWNWIIRFAIFRQLKRNRRKLFEEFRNIWYAGLPMEEDIDAIWWCGCYTTHSYCSAIKESDRYKSMNSQMESQTTIVICLKNNMNILASQSYKIHPAEKCLQTLAPPPVLIQKSLQNYIYPVCLPHSIPTFQVCLHLRTLPRWLHSRYLRGVQQYGYSVFAGDAKDGRPPRKGHFRRAHSGNHEEWR